MITEKRPLVITPNAAVEHRIANALEFIAHYLDRIDTHLENGNALLSNLDGMKQQIFQISHKMPR
jgi:hypothetical protein